MENTSQLVNVFVEGLARLTSYALTDKEKEAVVHGFHKFHERLERMSSTSSLRQLAIESQNQSGKVPRCQHEGTCMQNAIRGLLRTFLVGFGVKWGLEAVPHLISLRLFTRPSLLLRGFSRDTTSFASFLAVLVSSYKAILCTMRHIRGEKGSDYTNSLVAGMLAGLISAKLDRSTSRRNAISLYLFSRALQYGTVWVFERWASRQQTEDDKLRSRWMKRAHSVDVVSATRRKLEREAVEEAGVEPRVNWDAEWNADTKMDTEPEWNPQTTISWSTTVEPSLETKREARRSHFVRSAIHWARSYAPAALMTFSVTVITYVLVFHVESMPTGYVHLLFKSSGFDALYPGKAALVFKAVAQKMAESTTGKFTIPDGMPTKQFVSQIPFGDTLAKSFDDHIHHNTLTCGLFHPSTTSCALGMANSFSRGFPFAMKMYVPLNIAVQVMFKRGIILKDPMSVLLKIIKSSTRSSAFFALMSMAILQAPCIFRNMLGRDTVFGYIAGGIFGGLAVLTEVRSRHIELGMYCFLRALQMAWNVGIKKGMWSNVRHGEVMMLSASMAVLMSIFQNDPTTFTLTYRSIITRVFGKN
ncbi:hypothetical protein GGH15_001364 [Coemansia sp. RSA 562]|nr:hypothetical protein GGH15_001364 [Coemansia sp. RSA 562]KAJ2181845.1 hypothetical protein EV181_005118 [Coemansia sp. RSA 532]KAJ2257712.1 hypothetical protein GGH98_000651 [Coemansia sp. RSA 454]KAJ2283883.1 hypothetical protein GGH14_000525 [Coemansia sp. RSA 370]